MLPVSSSMGAREQVSILLSHPPAPAPNASVYFLVTVTKYSDKSNWRNKGYLGTQYGDGVPPNRTVKAIGA